MTDDRAAEPGAALPLDEADDARFSLLAAPLGGPAPAPHVGTHVGATGTDPADETAPAVTVGQSAPAAAGSGLEPDEAPDGPLAADDADAAPGGPVLLDAVQPDGGQSDGAQPLDQEPVVPEGAVAEAGLAVDDAAAPESDAHGSAAPDAMPDPDETAVLSTIGTTLPMWLPSTAPAVADPEPTIEPVVLHEPPAPSVARHRRQPWALLVLSILLALTLGLATYLLMTTRAYERRSDEWESVARSTGADLTQARADLEATTSDLTATRDQLATAQARIIELADEKAQLGDDRAVQRQLVDYQQRISAAAGNVATALTSCIDGQYKLIGYLENPSAYDQADLARFRTDVQTVCGAATDANTALQRELKK